MRSATGIAVFTAVSLCLGCFLQTVPLQKQRVGLGEVAVGSYKNEGTLPEIFLGVVVIQPHPNITGLTDVNLILPIFSRAKQEINSHRAVLQ